MSHGTAQSDDSDRYIRSITIVRHNVHPQPDSTLNWSQRLQNRFHIVTHENVIKRDLLFTEGDKLDEQLLQESERLLRKHDVYGSVDVTWTEAGRDSADVFVETEDQWTILPSFILESGGGLVGLGASLEEWNFLGKGKMLYAEVYNENDIGTSVTVAYEDPRMFGTRIEGEFIGRTGPLEKAIAFDLYQPFYASDTKWSYGFGGSFSREDERLFDGGKEVSRIRYTRRSLDLMGAMSWGERYKKKRLRLKYEFTDRAFDSLEMTTTPLPESELVALTGLKFSLEDISFAKDTRIDKFGRVEDITIGQGGHAEIRRAGFPIPVGVQRWEFQAGYYSGYQFGQGKYLFVDIIFDTWIEKNTVLASSLKYYWRTFDWQTLAFRFKYVLGKDLETHRQLILGGESGLRGYRAREFSGNQKMLFNVESRLFSNLKVLGLQVGGVVFLDAGNVWKRDEVFDIADLNFGTGFGFRIGQPNSPGSPVLRVDFGWALRREGGFALSLGVGQEFSQGSHL